MPNRTLILPIDQAEELFMTVRGDRPGETSAGETGLFLTRLEEILRHGPEALALVTACRRSLSICRPSPRPNTGA
jgi:hypothetical protein